MPPRSSARAAAAPRQHRERTVHVPLFGERLRELRGEQTIAEVCRAVRAFGLALDHSTLIHYERGTVKAPDPALLFALAHHYDVDDIGELIRLLVHERLGRPVTAKALHTVFVSYSWRHYSREQRRIAELFADLTPRSQDAIVFTLKKFHTIDAPPQPAQPVRRRGHS